MSEIQTQSPGQPQTFSRLNSALRLIPPKARLALLSGSLVLFGLICYTSLSAKSSTLNLVCRNGFRSAEIELSIDGKSIYSDHIYANHVSTNPKKLFGLLGKTTEMLSKSLVVPAGDHVIQVHLSASVENFDETTQRQLKLTPGSEGTLLVTAERSGMSVLYKPSAPAEAQNGSSYSGLFRSMLVMVFGSVVSAAIGFVVQEFLRSKRPV